MPAAGKVQGTVMMARNELIAGFDLGTTYFKVGLYDRQGQRRGLGRRAFDKQEPEPGHREAGVDAFRQMLKGALDDAVVAAECSRSDIKGVSYAAQANTFLLLDSAGTPLTPIVVWPDGRANPLPRDVQAFWAQPALLEATGLGLFGAEWMVAKLDWFRRECPELWSRRPAVMTLSDYLCFLMTGCRVGDAGTASLLGLWDLRGEQYYRPALERLGLAESQLARLHRPGTMTLDLGAGAATWLGLPAGIPFTIGGMDHHAAALGAGIGPVAPVSVSFGTSLVCFRPLEAYVARIGCCVGPMTDSDAYYQMSFCSPGTSVLDDYKEAQSDSVSYDELFALAESVPAGCDGLRAETVNGALTFLGERILHGRGHHVRAILELTGHNVARLLGDLNMPDEFLAKPVVLAVGGGAGRDLWMRVVAETAGVQVVPARPADTASKGAAMLSAVALGWFKDVNACASQWIVKGES